MRKKTPEKKSIFKWIRLILHGILNLFLLLFLVIQITVYFLFSQNGTLSLPEIIRNPVEKKIEKEGFAISFKSNGFDTTGHFIFDDVRIGLSDFGDPIFTANRVGIDLNFFYLFLGQVQFESVYINDATVWKLPVYGSDHTHAAILDRIFVQYEKDFKASQLAARLRFYDHNLYLDMLFPENFLSQLKAEEEETTTGKTEEQDIRRQFIAYYKSFIDETENIQTHIQGVKGGSISIKTNSQNKDTIIEAYALTPTIKLEKIIDNNTFLLESVKTRVKTKFPFDTQSAINLHATALKFSWNETVNTKDITLCATLNKDGHPKNVSLFAQTIVHNAYTQYPAVKSLISAHFQSPTQLSAHISSYLLHGDIHIDANVDLEKETVEGKIDSYVNPIFALNDPLIPEEVRVELKPLKLPESPHISGTFVFSDRWQFQQADLNLSIRNGSFYDINPRYAQGDVRISPKELLLYNAHGITKNYTAGGSFYQNLETLDYRFLLSGSIIPDHLTPILGDFWPEIWKQVSLGKKLPRAWVDVSGRWLDLDKIYVRVFAEGENVSYRGIDADNARLLVMYNPNVLRFININATRPEGKSYGNVNWFFKGDDSYAIEIDLFGQVYPAVAKQFVNEMVQRTIDSLEFKTAPLSTIKGIFYDPPFADYDRIDIHCISGKDFSYYGLPIDHADIHITVEQDNVTFPNMTLGLANGIFSGNVFYSENTKTTNEASIRINGKIVNADAEPFVQLIDKAANTLSKNDLGKATQTSEKEESKRIASDLSFSGKIDLSLDASGPFFVFEKLEGKGNILVNSNNLTTIHSFGFLSRLMQRIMLPSGSIIFRKFESDYTLSKGIFSLPNVSITSDLAKVSIKGSYNTDLDFLNFTGSLELLGASQSMLAGFFNNITGVFTGMLGFDIYGPIDDPKWIFSNNPTRIFYDPKERSQREQEKVSSQKN